MGDLIVGNGYQIVTRLGIGTNGKYLKSDGTSPSWQDAPSVDLTTIATDVKPSSDVAKNLGDETHRWLTAYIKNIYSVSGGVWSGFNGAFSDTFKLPVGSNKY